MSWIPSYKKPSCGGGFEIVTWSDGTDEQIVAMLDAHYNGDIDIHDYWSIGDERTVHLSAMSAMSPLRDTHDEQDVIMVLTEVGGKYLADGVTECAFQVDQKNCLNDKNENYNVMTYDDTYYENIPRRAWCNSIYYNSIPETLRPIFKLYINVTGRGNYSTSGTNTTTDYFALRAEREIFGYTQNGIRTTQEGNHIEYYKTTINQRKSFYNGYMVGRYWLRSPEMNVGRGAYVSVAQQVDSTESTYDNYYAGHHLAPFGVI